MEKEMETIGTVETAEEAKAYSLRELEDEDFWTVLDILTKTIPDDLKEAFTQVFSGEKTLKDVGYVVGADMAIRIIRNIPKAKEEIYSFCSSMSGISVEELKKAKFGTTPMIISDIFKEAKNASFFKELSKFFS